VGAVIVSRYPLGAASAERGGEGIGERSRSLGPPRPTATRRSPSPSRCYAPSLDPH